MGEAAGELSTCISFHCFITHAFSSETIDRRKGAVASRCPSFTRATDPFLRSPSSALLFSPVNVMEWEITRGPNADLLLDLGTITAHRPRAERLGECGASKVEASD